MKHFILIIILITSFSCSSQKATKNNWITDINFLKTELPKKHKDFYFKKEESDFKIELDKIKAQLNELTDFEIAIKLQQLIVQFGDSHTRIKWNKYLKKDEILPIKAIWFNDGIYVIKTTKNNKPLLGKKIVKINNVNISSITEKLSSIITVDNQSVIKKTIPELLTSIQLLEYFDIVKDENIKFEVETNSGSIEKHLMFIETFTKENKSTVHLKSLPYYLQNERKLFWSAYTKEDGIYYIQYNKCLSKEIEQKYGNPEKAKKLPSFLKFENEIFATIKSEKIDKLIFDMRLNSGGNSSQGTDFIKKLSEFESINHKGKLYVVVGKQTFSSAILNTLDFKKYTNAIIIGETTSGKPNHFGEVKSFILPKSNLKVYYSTKYFKRVDTDLNTIKPDIEIETSFEDFSNGIDPIFEWIKKQ